MVTTIIIALCVLTLLAYLFDVSAKKTQVPGVILLLMLGIGIRLLSDFFSLNIPNLRNVLHVLGTIGLILIVLEGSLDLELKKDKFPLIRDTLISAIVLLVICSLTFAYAFTWMFHVPFNIAIINAIPLGIISSAIAISSVYHLDPVKKEFVIYESSFSDIIGILLFNYVTLNSDFGLGSATGFFFQVLLVLIISASASFGLAILLHKITHHVKVIPIITILLLLYTVAKVLNLPSLVLILVFGIFLNNIRLLYFVSFKIPQFHDIIKPHSIEIELVQFKNLVVEVTFVVRSFFFIMFGYYTHLPSFLNPENIALALGIIGFILISRALYFKVMKLPSDPVLFVAPRGLITILLFFSIAESQKIPQINEGLLSQVIFISAFIMMIGLVQYRKEPEKTLPA